MRKNATIRQKNAIKDITEWLLVQLLFYLLCKYN